MVIHDHGACIHDNVRVGSSHMKMLVLVFAYSFFK
jgi:hypothetical protein